MFLYINIVADILYICIGNTVEDCVYIIMCIRGNRLYFLDKVIKKNITLFDMYKTKSRLKNKDYIKYISVI